MKDNIKTDIKETGCKLESSCPG